MLQHVAPLIMRQLACGMHTAAASSRVLSSLGASTSAAALGAPQPLAQPLEQLVKLIPQHEIEDGLPVIVAQIRNGEGSLYCHKLRKLGRTPGVLFSLPGEADLRLHFDQKQAAKHLRRYGRNGLQSVVMRLDVHGEDGRRVLASARVLAKSVHVNSRTLELENLALLFCPRNRRVLVPVPVTMWNEEIAPGVKKGGWLHMVNRTVPLLCEGWAVPQKIELDVRHMQVADIVRFQDVPTPAGCTVHVKDPLQPVVRCALKVAGD